MSKGSPELGFWAGFPDLERQLPRVRTKKMNSFLCNTHGRWGGRKEELAKTGRDIFNVALEERSFSLMYKH